MVKSYNWIDILACTHCYYYHEVGTHAAVMRCQNPKSEYNINMNRLEGELSTEQELKGCKEIKFSEYANKIPAFLFKIVPKDSNLRNLPLDQIVDGKALDLNPDFSAQELAGMYKQYRKMIDIFVAKGLIRFLDGKYLPPD